MDRAGHPIDKCLTHVAEILDPAEYAKSVAALAAESDRGTLDAAAELLTASDPRHRALAVDVLGILGFQDRLEPSDEPFAATRIELLVSAAKREHQPSVLEALARALGRFSDERAQETLVRLSDHADPGVREVVASRLSAKSDRAVAALMRLMGDSDEAVREWATASLAGEGTPDSPSVRAAFEALLEDESPSVRLEACTGLALRGDPRALEPLLDALESGVGVDATPLLEGAVIRVALATRDSRLCRALRAVVDQMIRRWGDEWRSRDLFGEELGRALKACACENK